jgi:hypothetical protein
LSVPETKEIFFQKKKEGEEGEGKGEVQGCIAH